MLPPRKAREVLAYEGLEGLVDGRPVRLFHGTTAAFSSFDTRRAGHRPGKLQARAVFFTPKKKLAWKIAFGARNAGLDPAVIDDLTRKNPRAGTMLRRFYQFGPKVWNSLTPERLGARPEEYADRLTRLAGGVDPNDLMDLSTVIRGSRYAETKSAEDASLDALFNLMTGLSNGTPPWVYRKLEQLGVDPKPYGPKVITVQISPKKIGVTTSKADVRHARARGYDAIVYAGRDVEDGVPEVIVFDPSVIAIESVDHGSVEYDD